MSDLIQNLNQIYDTKLQIKAAIGTQSDVFADYPGYITGMKPSGYTYVTVNGDHNIAGYAYVSVAVDGSTEYENTTISVNGDYNIASYAFAYVSVPIPAGYVLPAGTYNVTANGTYVVGDYANVDVNVPIDWASVGQAGYIVPSGTYNITTNGTVNIAAYANAYVNVQAILGHDGLSAENAYTVAEAIQRFSIASQDDFIYGNWVSDDVTYVTGIISKIHEISTQYHNCTFTISDDGTYETSDQYVDGADNLLLYRQGMEAGVWNMPSDTAPKVGDKITVYGKWTGATDYVIDEGFSTYWDNGANAYCGVSSLYREAPSGGYTVTQNGSELDLSSYSYVNVNVAGGGGQTIDPWHDYISIYDMIMNELTEADYVGSTIMSDFTYGYNTAQWTETVTIDTGEVDGNNEVIFEDKNVRINVTEAEDQGIIGQSLEDFPDLYDYIYPIIQNVTLSVATGDDVEDGFDYILDGELYAWNLNDMDGYVEEITENGFYPSGATNILGFYVNIEGGGSEPENWIFDQNVGDMETEYTFSFDSSTKAIIEEGTSESPVYLGTLVAPDATPIDIKGYYDNGYWYVGDVDNSSVIDWTNERQASDSDTIVLYSFENSEDSSVYDDLLISLVSDGNGDLTGEVRIYVLNNYTSEEGTEEFSIGYTEEEPEPESYTLEGGLFINGQGQYYIADEGDLADYINIIPKEDVTGTWSDKFSYLTVGKNTTITGYNYYNGGAMAIQAESYTQSSSIAYQTARLTNIEPYLDKEYYGLGQYYDSAYITVNRSFYYPNGTQLGIPREVYGYYFPNSSYTNRYKDFMVDVSYIVPAGDDIIGLCATAMAFGNTTYALDLQNIRYCEDFAISDSTYVTATTGIDGGITYYEIDLTQSGNYNDSSLYNSILSGGAFFADMLNGADDNNPIVHKLEMPSGTFVFDDADWVFLSNNEEMTTGSVVFNEDYNNNPTLQIDTAGVWAMDEFGNWNPTGVGELTVNGINSLKIRFYVNSSDNTWQYDWLIDVDYEFTPDEGGEEPEPEE